MTQKIPNWVWIVGVGYGVYKFSGAIADFFNQFKKGLDTVTAPVSNAIANSILANDPNMAPGAQTAGSAVFPNGAQVALRNLQVSSYNGANGFEARVTYQGRTYRLAPHDANGNYPATPV